MIVRPPFTVPLLMVGFAAVSPAQIPDRATTLPAPTGSFATEPGGFLLAIPGVTDDFVLFADGQWQLRADGTARYSAYVNSAGAVDRDLFLELDFSGRIDPGMPPPAGSPVTTLLPQAYAPLGPVDPSTFAYYTQVTGTIVGLRAFAGARIDVGNVAAAQFGNGANNQNELAGFAVDLDLTIVQPPTSATFLPTGSAKLRGNLLPSVDMCATHVDANPAVSGNADRLAFDLPGVAGDYLFLQSALWNEDESGAATLAGPLKRQSDYADAWQLQLTFGGRVDPDDQGHPPQGFPQQELLPILYAAQGGPIDPANWRYYTQATGTLTGEGINEGGIVQLTLTGGACQVGLGAGQGNIFFGAAGELTASVSQQPTNRLLTITGDARLRANLATGCILPTPQVMTGSAQVVESVTHDRLTYTGSDLGFVVQAAIGPSIVGDDDRRWLEGYVRVVDHETLELSVPQGLVAASYPLTFLNVTRTSNLVSVDVQEPADITMLTENDRRTGEPQNWVTYQGSLPGRAIAVIVVSLSDLPSSAPGIVDLAIGNQFTEYLVVGAAFQDPASRTSLVQAPPISAFLLGLRVYSQAAIFDTALPLYPSNVWQTDY